MRGRRLSPEEIELWRTVAHTITPRPGAQLPAAPPKPEPPPPPPEPAGVLKPGAGSPAATPRRKPDLPPLAPLEKRYRQKVMRGRVDIEAAIDLHGLNQAEAHHALHGFLHAEHGRGARLVLVVTGKGRPGAGPSFAPEVERGVLRRMVPLWLRAEMLRPLVLGFEEAGAPHGGFGALYVRLRRRPA